MKDLLQYIVEQLVSKPEAVSIDAIEREDGLTLELRVAPEDIGKVIGRGGSVAKDLRTLVKSAARDGKKVSVDIMD